MRTAWPTATVVALTWLFGQVPTAHALDPSRAVHHYAQRDLGTREGLPQGSVESLAQTPTAIYGSAPRRAWPAPTACACRSTTAATPRSCATTASSR